MRGLNEAADDPMGGPSVRPAALGSGRVVVAASARERSGFADLPPSMSQIDTEVLAAMPHEYRREVEAFYGARTFSYMHLYHTYMPVHIAIL